MTVERRVFDSRIGRCCDCQPQAVQRTDPSLGRNQYRVQGSILWPSNSSRPMSNYRSQKYVEVYPIHSDDAGSSRDRRDLFHGASFECATGRDSRLSISPASAFELCICHGEPPGISKPCTFHDSQSHGTDSPYNASITAAKVHDRSQAEPGCAVVEKSLDSHLSTMSIESIRTQAGPNRLSSFRFVHRYAFTPVLTTASPHWI